MRYKKGREEKRAEEREGRLLRGAFPPTETEGRGRPGGEALVCFVAVRECDLAGARVVLVW